MTNKIYENTSLIDTIHDNLPVTIWSFKRSIGSIVLIDGGEKISTGTIREKEYFIGSFSFTLYLCNWILYQNGKIILTCDNTCNCKYNDAANCIIGKKILTFKEIVARRRLLIEFEDDFRMIVKEDCKNYSYNDDMLYGFINGIAWRYSPHRRFYWEKGK